MFLQLFRVIFDKLIMPQQTNLQRKEKCRRPRKKWERGSFKKPKNSNLSKTFKIFWLQLLYLPKSFLWCLRKFSYLRCNLTALFLYFSSAPHVHSMALLWPARCYDNNRNGVADSNSDNMLILLYESFVGLILLCFPINFSVAIFAYTSSKLLVSLGTSLKEPLISKEQYAFFPSPLSH